ncbi:hypothetical protein L2449_10685, partial [Mesorhizobium muleiense]|uniref:hypothetical protein n=1 Tax=Mesorhizobium muleiense TaxID=1004279 RepID=UPI001F1E43F2
MQQPPHIVPMRGAHERDPTDAARAGAWVAFASAKLASACSTFLSRGVSALDVPDHLLPQA